MARTENKILGDDKLELLKLKKEAYYIYKQTHGNRDTSYDKARRKLTRNVLLADRIRAISGNQILYKYGCLDILVRDNEVIRVHNSYNKKYNFKKDIIKYNELNRLLGIEPDGKELGWFKKLFVDTRLKFMNI